MALQNDEIQEIISSLEELGSDMTVPKNIKLKIEGIIGILRSAEKSDISMRINKSLNMLDEISDDNNLQPYSRTQIWNIVSLLESLQS